MQLAITKPIGGETEAPAQRTEGICFKLVPRCDSVKCWSRIRLPIVDPLFAHLVLVNSKESKILMPKAETDSQGKIPVLAFLTHLFGQIDKFISISITTISISVRSQSIRQYLTADFKEAHLR